VYLCGFESLQLLLGYCEGRRGGTGRHVPQVSLEAEIILQTSREKQKKSQILSKSQLTWMGG